VCTDSAFLPRNVSIDVWMRDAFGFLTRDVFHDILETSNVNLMSSLFIIAPKFYMKLASRQYRIGRSYHGHDEEPSFLDTDSVRCNSMQSCILDVGFPLKIGNQNLVSQKQKSEVICRRSALNRFDTNVGMCQLEKRRARRRQFPLRDYIASSTRSVLQDARYEDADLIPSHN